MSEASKSTKRNKKRNSRGGGSKPASPVAGRGEHPSASGSKSAAPGAGRGEHPSASGSKSAAPGAGRGKHPSAWGSKPAAPGAGRGEHPSAWGSKPAAPGAGRGEHPSASGSKSAAPGAGRGEHPSASGSKSAAPGAGRGEHPSAWGSKPAAPGAGRGEHPSASGSKSAAPGAGRGKYPSASGSKSAAPGAGRGEQPSASGSKPAAPGAGRGKPPSALGAEQRQPEQPTPKGKKGVTAKKEQQLMSDVKIVQATSKLTLSDPSSSGSGLLELVPKRKDRQGKKEGGILKVEANHFPIIMQKPKLIAYQYAVVIEPDTPKYMRRPAWNEFIRRNFPGKYPAYDGCSIAVNAGPLFDGDSKLDHFQVFNPETEKMKDYMVEVKFAATVNLEKLLLFINSGDLKFPMAELAVIDVVLKNHPANILIQGGRSFFKRPSGNIISLGEGMELWYGYYQSVSLGWKMYLNIDTAHKGFPISDILKTVEEICLTDFRGNVTPLGKTTILEPRGIEKLSKHLKNLKVEYKIPECPDSKRVYKVNDVRKIPANKEVFTLEGNKNTNVVQYYADFKNYAVKYPNLPCLWVGSTKNTIYVPMELCTVIPGQVRFGKLTENQTANIIKFAANPPSVRKEKIANALKYSELSNPFANEFGISVGGEFEKIDARVLNAPMLESDREINVQRGQWQVNKFHKAMPLKNWCVLILDDRAFRLEKDFITEIIEQAKFMGMKPESPISHKISCDPFRNPNSIKNSFIELRRLNVDLVFVIIPDRGDLYSKVKKISEIEVGVLTQCIRSSTLKKTFSPMGTNRGMLSNILLKVNAKLNGINHAIHPDFRPRCLRSVTMVVGADVTHPPPESKTVPSIAAVAASHDTKATQYNTIRKLQPPKVEIIQNFKEIMMEQLLYFYRKTGFKPERIIIFRDGVSEGQVEIVLHEELRAVQQACVSLQAGDNKMDYQPLITFVIVQKRHHTRFFPMPGSKYCNDKFQNVPAGTCVDTKIVHPRDLDFYLVSHWSRLGTARPTKYKLIYDDSDMTEDELESLTYYLCHLISRCSKTLSYPAPTYYAHLAAFRARVHLTDKQVNMSSDVDRERGQQHINVKDFIVKDSPMFFI